MASWRWGLGKDEKLPYSNIVYNPGFIIWILLCSAIICFEGADLNSTTCPLMIQVILDRINALWKSDRKANKL